MSRWYIQFRRTRFLKTFGKARISNKRHDKQNVDVYSFLVKQDVLDRCRDQLFSILKCDALHSDGFELSHCLLYHHNDKVRFRYRDIAKTKGVWVSKSETKSHIQTLLIKCGLVFDMSESEMQINTKLERKQCTFCSVDASITCFYEEEAENMLTAKFDATDIHYIKENLEWLIMV